MKKLIAIISTLCLIFSFAACGEGGNDDEKKEKDRVSVEFEKDNEDKKDKEDGANDKENDEEKNEEDSDKEINEDISEKPEEKPTEPAYRVDTESKNVLAEDEAVVIDDICEFSLDYYNITDDVLPPYPSSYYSHYPADDGKLFADVCISYKNLEAEAVGADEIIDGTLYYGAHYEFRGFSVIEEDNRGDFTYASINSIDPLATEYLHYLFEIPAEINDGNGDIYIVLNIKDNEYAISVREGEKGNIALRNEEAVKKNNGEVSELEAVLIEDECEFYVEFSGIKSKVEPPYPESYYSYYEADDGKTYVEVCFAYRNLSSSYQAADEVIGASLEYAGKYKYTGFSTIEENSRGDFTYTNITSVDPMCTEYIHYLFEVPEEVSSSDESIVVNFKISGNEYSYKVR